MTTAYRVPVMEKFSWQDPITSILSAQPAGPAKNDRYIVGPTATGAAWLGQEKKIAWFDGTNWKFDNPAQGWRIFNKADNTFYSYLAGVWDNSSTVGDLTITGTEIDTTANQVDWTLKDNQASALEFVTATDVSMLNMDTRNNAEKITVGVDLAVIGDIDLSNAAKVINIKPDAMALSVEFGTTSFLNINATDMVESLNVNMDMVVTGDLTVNGVTTTVNTQELLVTDKLITLNNNGVGASLPGSGIEIEADNAVAAYFKLGASDSTLWDLKANNGNVLTFDINASKTLTIAGDLNVEADSAINHDVTSDASPSFSNLTLSGGTVNIVADEADAFSLYDGTTNIFQIDSTTLAKRVVINSALVINVGDITMKAGGTIVDTDAAMTLKDHNNASVTVLEAYTAYQDRAQYDVALGCIVFPEGVNGLDVIAA